MNEDRRQLNWSTVSWGDARSPLPALAPELMGLLLEHVSTRVAVIDRRCHYVYANREALRFMGLPPGRVIGKHMSEVLDPGVYASFVPIFERLFAGESLHVQGWVDYQRQGPRYREQALVPYRPGGGEVEAVVVCGLDHTELRLSEQELAQQQEALRTSEALKAAIFDHALAALVSTDAEGRIVEFNPSASAMFGHERAAVLGRPVGEVVIPPRYRAAHDAGMQRLASGDAGRMLGRRVEMHGLRADGREFPIEMVLWRTDAAGTFFYTASIADLSERHNAAREIERQRDALRQSEKLSAMGSLLAGVAHELNNPLAIVMGRAALVEEKCENRPEFQQDARRIYEAAERCGRIVRTFLNMARSRPGERSEVALNEVVQGACDMLAYTLRSHGIELQLALAAGLPVLEADANQLSQVVLNLLVNAQQALAPVQGARRIVVSTGLGHGDGATRQLWMRVVDTGPGVPPELRARLFEPFSVSKPDGISTGLGLSVSRSVARQHGGDLVLEESGAGAAFCLHLPLPAAQAFPAPPASAHLLVVSSESDLAELTRALLEMAGYDVAVAESGAVALELLATASFDAIVCDTRLSDLDGTALWQQVQARHAPLARRTLFVTSEAPPQPATERLRRTGRPTLDRPYAKAELLTRVAQLLR